MIEDILLNPNVAYLFLVAGFAFAILSLLSPGTGVLEVAALFALLLAGWGVYNLPVNYWALGVLLVGVIPFLLAVRRSGRPVYLAVSIVALVAGSAFLFRGEGWRPAVDPVLALVVSVLLAGFFWIAARKALEAEQARPSHDLGALIGLHGEAKSPIHHEGSVQVAGELWTARSEKPIPDGAQVWVTGRDGFILEVAPHPVAEAQPPDAAPHPVAEAQHPDTAQPPVAAQQEEHPLNSEVQHG